MSKPSKPDPHISPDFNLSNPVGSFFSVFRYALTSPRRFFLGYSTPEDLKSPAIYAAIIGVLSAVIAALTRYALTPVFEVLFGPGTGDEVYGLGAIAAIGFAVVFPAFVALAAAVYLLAIRVFVGKVGSFGQLFGMAAFAMSAMVFAWVPFIGAFAITYSLLIAMAIGIRYVLSTTLVTALIVTLTAFVPLSLALVALRGIAFQLLGS